MLNITYKWRSSPTHTRLTLQRGFFTLFKTSQREHIEPPPSLPDPQTVDVEDECVLEYVDVRPDPHTSIEKTFVFIHGAPGTYQDFRYLIARLQERDPNARMIGLNLPGFGGSYVKKERYYELISALPAVRLTFQAIHRLCDRNERIFLVGHSFGGHAAMNIGALNLTDKHQRLNIHGLVLLASAGLQPHRAMKPRMNAVTNHLLQISVPQVSNRLALLVKSFFTSVLGFSSQFPPNHYVAGIFRSGTTDFSVIQRHVHQLRDAHVPTFCAWSVNDALMDPSVPLTLAQTLQSQRRVAFVNGSHNLQKTRADVLADEITQWTQRVLADSATTTLLTVEANVEVFN